MYTKSGAKIAVKNIDDCTDNIEKIQKLNF